MAETGLTMSDAVDSVRGAVRDVFETGKGLVSDLMAAAGSAQLPSMSLGCACARPAACWLPEVLPPVHSTVCAGSVARVRFTTGPPLGVKQRLSGPAGTDPSVTVRHHCDTQVTLS